MGSSERQRLHMGSKEYENTWQKDLRQARKLIEKTRRDVWKTLDDEDQYNNAQDDGELAGRLGVCIEILDSELPKCRGIDLGDGGFSGCDASAGDCPTCGS